MNVLVITSDLSERPFSLRTKCLKVKRYYVNVSSHGVHFVLLTFLLRVENNFLTGCTSNEDMVNVIDISKINLTLTKELYNKNIFTTKIPKTRNKHD